MAKRIGDRLAKDGEIIRGYMGITLVDVDADAANFLDYTGTSGIVVTSVTRNSPAAEAGLEAHDIITHVNRSIVADAASFREMIADLKPGTRAPINVHRDGSQQRLLLTVGRRPEMQQRRGR
jgi:S1-C subfamily serine protease